MMLGRYGWFCTGSRYTVPLPTQLTRPGRNGWILVDKFNTFSLSKAIRFGKKLNDSLRSSTPAYSTCTRVSPCAIAQPALMSEETASNATGTERRGEWEVGSVRLVEGVHRFGLLGILAGNRRDVHQIGNDRARTCRTFATQKYIFFDPTQPLPPKTSVHTQSRRRFLSQLLSHFRGDLRPSQILHPNQQSILFSLDERSISPYC